MREAGAIMIARAVEENLSFIFEPAERAGMDHPIAVPLKMSAPVGRSFLVLPASCLAAQLRVRGQRSPLAHFQFLPRHRHSVKLILQNILHRDALQFEEAVND